MQSSTPLQNTCWSFTEYVILLYREPDSTYFELPQTSHPERGTSSTMPNNRAEVCMDVYQMRDLNDNVMVRKKSQTNFSGFLLLSVPVAHNTVSCYTFSYTASDRVIDDGCGFKGCKCYLHICCEFLIIATSRKLSFRPMFLNHLIL